MLNGPSITTGQNTKHSVLDGGFLKSTRWAPCKKLFAALWVGFLKKVKDPKGLNISFAR